MSTNSSRERRCPVRPNPFPTQCHVRFMSYQSFSAISSSPPPQPSGGTTTISGGPSTCSVCVFFKLLRCPLRLCVRAFASPRPTVFLETIVAGDDLTQEGKRRKSLLDETEPSRIRCRRLDAACRLVACRSSKSVSGSRQHPVYCWRVEDFVCDRM